jgi:hypothetical protein
VPGSLENLQTSLQTRKRTHDEKAVLGFSCVPSNRISRANIMKALKSIYTEDPVIALHGSNELRRLLERRECYPRSMETSHQTDRAPMTEAYVRAHQRRPRGLGSGKGIHTGENMNPLSMQPQHSLRGRLNCPQTPGALNPGVVAMNINCETGYPRAAPVQRKYFQLARGNVNQLDFCLSAHYSTHNVLFIYSELIGRTPLVQPRSNP